MQDRQDAHTARCPNRNLRARNLLIFGGCALAWVVFDRITKLVMDSYATGTTAWKWDGVVSFTLAHNTGAAWGVFSNSALAIGLFTVAICLMVLVFAIVTARRGSVIEMVCLALVLGGGIGNMIDRFTLGYVVDFINPLFISFPTFNVADIGITCGLFLLVFVYFIQLLIERKER